MKRNLRSVQIAVSRLTVVITLFLGFAAKAPVFPPPQPPLYLSGTNLIWHFTNGFPDTQFFVVATTNLLLPSPQWTYVSTNQFDHTGSCTLVLPVYPDTPCRFYRLAVP